MSREKFRKVTVASSHDPSSSVGPLVQLSHRTYRGPWNNVGILGRQIGGISMERSMPIRLKPKSLRVGVTSTLARSQVVFRAQSWQKNRQGRNEGVRLVTTNRDRDV